ncbi:MAG: PDZ domain-containing protein [Proteobacteria bacterium]|nr:PDZ domain-containing protein [Pseudomonadota bacterium]
MAIWRKSLVLILFALISAPGIAQQSARDIERAAEREVGESAARQQTIEVQMREAEERLAAAARQIAELSTSNLPAIVEIERRIHMDGRAVLGITIGSGDGDGPVEGVSVRGVSPGGAAADAGLRSGDIITAVNGESLTAASDKEANARLIEFMSGVEEGDVVDVEYLRNGKQASVEVRPNEMSPLAYAFRLGRGNYSLLRAPNAPGFDFSKFIGFSDGSGWGHMEMVALTERLGRYFGTDKGLLVVRAPDDESLKLQDGDVIQSIDGREPTSVSHAMRILGSYQSGEQLELQIMRDQRKQTLKIEMPDNRSSSWILPRPAPRIESDLVIVPKARVHREDRT